MKFFSGGDFYLSKIPQIRVIASFVGEGRLLVEISEKVRAVTPGQSAVFYDGETLLGGGVICG